MLSRFMIFCGKGGVGKTALSLASALAIARRQGRVLLVTSHPLPELALSVSLAGLEEAAPETAARLFVVHIDSRQVLRKLIRDRFPGGFVADRLLNSSIYQSFVEVVPGLKEFAFLHRLQELAERSHAHRRAYEHLIWDAPATGHFIQTLKAATNFESYFAGPLASRSREVSEYFQNSPLQVIPVALAEEMSVEETLDLLDELRHLQVRYGPVACNLVSPMLARSWRSPGAPAAEPGSGLQEFLARRLASEQGEVARLREGARANCIPVRRLPRTGSDLDFLWALSRELEAGGLLDPAGAA